MRLEIKEANLLQDRTRDTEYGKRRSVKFAYVDTLGNGGEMELGCDPALDLSKVPFLRPFSLVLDVSARMSGYNTYFSLTNVIEANPVK